MKLAKDTKSGEKVEYLFLSGYLKSDPYLLTSFLLPFLLLRVFVVIPRHPVNAYRFRLVTRRDHEVCLTTI